LPKASPGTSVHYRFLAGAVETTSHCDAGATETTSQGSAII